MMFAKQVMLLWHYFDFDCYELDPQESLSFPIIYWAFHNLAKQLFFTISRGSALKLQKDCCLSYICHKEGKDKNPNNSTSREDSYVKTLVFHKDTPFYRNGIPTIWHYYRNVVSAMNIKNCKRIAKQILH